MRLKPSSTVAKEKIVVVHDVLRREVSRATMRRVTNCAWIGTTASTVLRYAQLDKPRGFKPAENFYAQSRVRMEELGVTTSAFSSNYIEQTVKLGACALRFMAEIDRGYVPQNLGEISYEMVFELMRAFATRGTDRGLSYRIRTALTMLARGADSRRMTVDVDHEFYVTFGFSPCNKKPLIPHLDWWLGDPSEAMGKLRQVVWPCSSQEFVVVALFANAFRLGLRASLAARISDDNQEVRIEGKNAKGEHVAIVLPVETALEKWAVKQIRVILNQHSGACGLPLDPPARSKMVFAMEKAMEDARILPCDTDYILAAIPLAQLRAAVERVAKAFKPST